MKLFLGGLLFLQCLLGTRGYKLDNPKWVARREISISNSHTAAPPKLGIDLVRRARLGSFIDFRGGINNPQQLNAADREILTGAVGQAHGLARAALFIAEDNALYTTIFGDRDAVMYQVVNNNLGRVFDLLESDEVAGEVNFVVYNSDVVTRHGDVPAFTQGNTIYINDLFFTQLSSTPDVRVNPGDAASDTTWLDRTVTTTRGAVMFHELIHFVSRQRMQGVVSDAINAGAVFRSALSDGELIPNPDFEAAFAQTDGGGDGAVLDIRLGQIGGQTISTTDSALQQGISPGTVAYDINTAARLARTDFGRFATVLNAQSYTFFAVAAQHNINNNVFTPNPAVPGLPPLGGPTSQISIYRAEIETNDSSAMAQIMREKENLSWLGSMITTEKINKNVYLETFELR